MRLSLALAAAGLASVAFATTASGTSGGLGPYWTNSTTAEACAFTPSTIISYVPVTMTITATVTPSTTVDMASIPAALSPTTTLFSTLTRTHTHTVQPASSSVDAVSATYTGPYFFSVADGTTGWLGGNTPPASESFMIGTSTLLVVPVPVSRRALKANKERKVLTLKTIALSTSASASLDPTTTLHLTSTITGLVTLTKTMTSTGAGTVPSSSSNGSTVSEDLTTTLYSTLTSAITRTLNASTPSQTSNVTIPSSSLLANTTSGNAATTLTIVFPSVPGRPTNSTSFLVVSATMQGGAGVSASISANSTTSLASAPLITSLATANFTVTATSVFTVNSTLVASPVTLSSPGASGISPHTVIMGQKPSSRSIRHFLSTLGAILTAQDGWNSTRPHHGPHSHPTFSLQAAGPVPVPTSTDLNSSVVLNSSTWAAPPSTSTLVLTMSVTPVPMATAPSTFATLTLPRYTNSTSASVASATASGTGPTPSVCGESGNFTLTWDDEPTFIPDNSTGEHLFPPVFNPYHHMFFANGYAYVPTQDEPYTPESAPNLAIFLTNSSNTDTGSPNAGSVRPGEISGGPRAALDAFWFNAYGGYFGCDNDGPETCVMVVSGYKWDNALKEESMVVQQNHTMPTCTHLIEGSCEMEPIYFFTPAFRGLAGIQFEAIVNGSVPRSFMVDNLNLGWWNNTCAAGLYRQSSRK